MLGRPGSVMNITAAVVTVLLLASACGTDNNRRTVSSGAKPPPPPVAPECARGAISGAGATFPLAIIQQWVKDFGAACPGATVNYQGVGSGAGIQQFTSRTVDFGASDAVMTPEEQREAEASGGPVLHVPWTAGGIAVMFNLRGVAELNLSPRTLAGIFAGKVKRWNDAAIAAENRGVKLPPLGIQVVHRADGSGTTKVFTAFLSATASSVWTVGSAKDVAWPTGQGAKGSDGVAGAVKQTEGTIGYAEVSYARTTSLRTAKVQNGAGAFVAPSAEGVSAALREAQVPPDLKVALDYAPEDPAAYPISTTTWALVHARPPDADKARVLRSFLLYALGPGQAVAPELFYAPLPKELTAQAEAAVRSLPT